MKNRLLKDLYDRFYSPPGFSALKQEIKECHQTLIEAMDKQGRRLMLRIIDAKDYMIENISIDSFISGFELAWKLFEELNNYENEHSISCRKARELSARFLFKREEEE